MSLIGTRILDLVPSTAAVVRSDVIVIEDDDGQPTGETILEEGVDLDGDGTEDVVRSTLRDAQERRLSASRYFVISGKYDYDAFVDRNEDGFIDGHFQQAVRTTDGGTPWTGESLWTDDSNFDGRPDRRVLTKHGRGGDTKWAFEDVDFDGDYDTETKDSKGSKTTRDISLDVSVFE